ncbi:MAG: PrgI family protein [Candidatus Nealsonbacteria bacterium]
MRFIVPQFIEHEAKVVGPLTFTQFIYVGLAGGACFIIYFILPLPIFIAACVVLIGGALALSFLKINGRSLPSVLTSFLSFNLMPKMYIWKKKDVPVVRAQKIVKKSQEQEEELPLKIAEGSQLKKIKTHIENNTQ